MQCLHGLVVNGFCRKTRVLILTAICNSEMEIIDFVENGSTRELTCADNRFFRKHVENLTKAFSNLLANNLFINWIA
jgi:hypothetical protein